MSNPTFKRRRRFVHDLIVPCLWTSLPNSIVPGLAAKYIESHVEEPHFDIFLRGRNPAEITEWQKEILEQLITNGGLETAIEQGINNYHSQHSESEFPEKERQAIEDMKRNGILPHFVLNDLVIDASTRNVLLSLSTESDGNLQEHGAVVYLDGDTWRFDSDYIHHYLAEVEEAEGSLQHDDFVEEPADTSKSETPPPPDISFMLGQWILDDAATRERLLQKGETEKEVDICILSFSGRGFELTEKNIFYWWKNRRQKDFGIITKIRQRDNKVAISYTDSSETDGYVRTWECVYEDGCIRIGDFIHARTVDLDTAWKKH